MGVRWRVGDRPNINIWTEPWVPRETDFKVHGVGNEDFSLVSQFIMRGERDRQRVEGDLQGDECGECSTGSTPDPSWKDIWSLKFSPLVKSFIWKCANPNERSTSTSRSPNISQNLQLLGCPENSDQVTCVLWFLCKYMNGIIFDDKAIDGESIWQTVYLLDESYKAACLKPSISALQSRGGESDSWQKPNQGFLKMNTDASWLRSTRRGAAGQASTF
ncbi:hypothetical protein LIER_42683 [Lithospermum erythrorhizon]|uniref:Reverse transcriptase zinc-binding domain-containing protein n=1 Tax=Lithospermum erythrorhizon TaxID=34254 RepID=A0AAV3NRX0_LITER